MQNYEIMLGLLICGFLLMIVGFSYRRREWGVRLIAVGLAVTLAPIVLRIYLALQTSI